MSEEVLGAIKFQHQNLLNLVDYLRENLAVRTTVVQQARDELEKRKQDQECPLPPVPLSLYPWQQRPYKVSTENDAERRRIEELERTVGELRKRLEDREAMPPPPPVAGKT
jgi:hypothetical protein